MSNVLKDTIIVPSWNMVKEDSKIKKIFFLPGLLSIIFLTVLLVYQSIYTYVKIFGKNEETLVIILKFLHSDYSFQTLTVFVVFVIAYFLITPIFEGGLVKYLEHKHNNKILETHEIFSMGLFYFLPLFKYNNIFSEFKFISILNGYLFIIRFLGLEYIHFINVTFIGLFILGTIFNLLLSYAKFELIVENKSIFESIGISSKIMILNLKRTIQVYFLLLFLNIRVIFNFFILLLFPILIVIIIGFITSKVFLVMAITIMSIVFLCFIVVLGYLAGVLDIFTTSIWYFTYLEGKKKLNEIQKK